MTSAPAPVSVPDAAKLAHVKAVCENKEPFRVTAAEDETFVKSMREIVDWHREHCAFYDRLLQTRGFGSEQINSIADCSSIPAIHANFFKTHEVLSISRDDVHTHLTSSGTTGQKSQMFFDAWSRQCGLKMVDAVFESYGFYTPDQPANYLLFSYELPPGSKLGTATTSHMLCKYAPTNREFCALRQTGDGGSDFDCFGCISALQSYAEEGLPVRIIGFPAFFNFTLDRMDALGMPALKLHPDSLVFLAGGWKGHADKIIPKMELYDKAHRLLGISRENCRDAYGAVEHSVPYVESSEHHLREPVWSRVFIRDVRTLEPLGYEQPGFLHFVSPYITSTPAHSVMMGDLAILHEPDETGRPWFEILGRAGTSKNRSCAVAASELMKKGVKG